MPVKGWFVMFSLEALPIFLKLLDGKSEEEHRLVARRSCFYAMLLMFFFLLFGTLILWIFGVPLSMVRIVGGIILMRIGFELFSPSSSGASIIASSPTERVEDVAFIPLAMPIMFGPGGHCHGGWDDFAGEHSEFEFLSFVAVSVAIVATMFTTYLFLASARKVLNRIGPKGIDAATRIIGFFVSAMGMGLIFDGVTETLQTYGIVTGR